MGSGRLNSPLSERDYARVRALIRDRSGLEVQSARRSELERAVDEAFAATGARSGPELCALLAQDGHGRTMDTIVDALAVGESHFFRGRAHFEALRSHVLPDLIARRQATRRLRIWSAGCAAGQEPYSLAILLDRLLPDIDDWDIHILATDVARSALDEARRGVYRRWSFREVPPLIEQAYFVAHGELRELVPRIRDRVTFAPLNLVTDPYPATRSSGHRMDLVVCRNVLIYFDEAVRQDVVRRLGETLADDGWLLLGHAEAMTASVRSLTTRRVGEAIVHRRANPRPARETQ